MTSIYMLTLRQLSGRWRLLIMSVLAAMPVFMAVLAVQSSRAPSVEEFEIVALGAMLAGSISPLVVLAAASAAFANEIEDRTLANLTLAPIPRWQIAETARGCHCLRAVHCDQCFLHELHSVQR